MLYNDSLVKWAVIIAVEYFENIILIETVISPKRCTCSIHTFNMASSQLLKKPTSYVINRV